MPETILILLATQVLAMMSPGPDMFLIIKNTIGTHSRLAALFTILGIAVGLTVHIGISISGLSLIIVNSPGTYRIIRYMGAAYLVYIGIKSFTSHSSLSKINNAAVFQKSNGLAFREGLFTNLLNPKVTLYIIGLFTQLINPVESLSVKATYSFILVVEAVVVWLILSQLFRLPTFRKWITGWTLWIDRAFGLILIAIASTVIFTY